MKLSHFLIPVALPFLLSVPLAAQSVEIAQIDFQSDPFQSSSSTSNQDLTLKLNYGPSLVSAGADAGWSQSSGTLFARAMQLSGEPILALGKSSKNLPEDEDRVIETASFIEFSLAPKEDQRISLDELRVRIGSQRLAQNEKRTESFTTQFFIRSSVDDYQNTLGAGRIYLGAASSASNTHWEEIEVDLRSDPSFENISKEVQFRIYIYLTTSEPNWLQVARVDDIVLTGTIH
ncbi:hypothetical protein [Puniceicoccus vermicola]|uniref:Uncharacterized protein n=1 Tax=Puniceicoccus vermicola TaxID=388746 RepID=A0A7X1AZ49_9BACT|nr:hypothetical protein [Puniceicoccus vermicola]MBC2602648.1 hypothetical protein [Puniceicoccus vermicola]